MPAHEMTYAEHVEAKKKLVIRDYNEEIRDVLRNIELRPQDLVNNFLGPEFFHREDIPTAKKMLLSHATNNATNQILKITQ